MFNLKNDFLRIQYFIYSTEVFRLLYVQDLMKLRDSQLINISLYIFSNKLNYFINL